MSPLDPSSISSSISNFGVEHGIFLRIINREYRLILGEIDTTGKDDVKTFQNGIKISYFYDCMNRYNHNHVAKRRKNDKKKFDDIESKKSKKYNTEENVIIMPVGKKVKSKTYAKIPLQFYEFENVRLYSF